MLNRLTDAIDFQAQALSLRSERQRVIASNIANADTPGYVARDMDFSAALREATGTASATDGVARSTMAATQAGHLQAARPTAGDNHLVYAARSQDALDQNTVDMDRERASFADNALHYEATLRFINSGVRTMLTAITGQ